MIRNRNIASLFSSSFETEEKIHYRSFVRIGLQLLEDPTRRRESQTTKKRTSAGTQRQKTSASIVTQKTTLPQVETIVRRDRVYQVKSIRIDSKIFVLLFRLEIQNFVYEYF